jgi:hypothetical protein
VSGELPGAWHNGNRIEGDGPIGAIGAVEEDRVVVVDQQIALAIAIEVTGVELRRV